MRDVVKAYDTHAALRGMSLDVAGGELLALLGPSGSGKTTLLRIIAGLETHEAGTIAIGGQDMTALPVQARGVGFVFQHYALFRHMTIFDNVAYGLKARGRGARPPKAEIRERVMTLLDLVQLGGLDRRYPSQLSGGQRQRVALARALAIEPRVLLLDEPFGALDARVRKDLRRWLRDLHARTGQTTVFVTHDQDEAMELADRVAILDAGRIEQVGRPSEIYAAPTSAFVASFVGNPTGLDVTLAGGEVHLGRFALGPAPAGFADGPALRAAERPRPHPPRRGRAGPARQHRLGVARPTGRGGARRRPGADRRRDDEGRGFRSRRRGRPRLLGPARVSPLSVRHSPRSFATPAARRSRSACRCVPVASKIIFRWNLTVLSDRPAPLA